MSTKATLKYVIDNHNLMHLASLDENGNPCVRGLDYAADEDYNIYFITYKNSRKVVQIKNNQNISFVIDHDCLTFDDLLKVKYIKGSGIASEVVNLEEVEKAVGLILQKFPYLKNLPGDSTDFTVIKVIMKDVLVTDHTISFGHTDSLKF